MLIFKLIFILFYLVTQLSTKIDPTKCLNRVTLLGYAVGPATSVPFGENELVYFTLATNEIRRTRNDEIIRSTEFHQIKIFKLNLAKKALNVVQKG